MLKSNKEEVYETIVGISLLQNLSSVSMQSALLAYRLVEWGAEGEGGSSWDFIIIIYEYLYLI